jgi:hypothetical protein
MDSTNPTSHVPGHGEQPMQLFDDPTWRQLKADDHDAWMNVTGILIAIICTGLVLALIAVMVSLALTG